MGTRTTRDFSKAVTEACSQHRSVAGVQPVLRSVAPQENRASLNAHHSGLVGQTGVRLCPYHQRPCSGRDGEGESQAISKVQKNCI